MSLSPHYRVSFLRALPPRVLVPFGALIVLLATALVAAFSW